MKINTVELLKTVNSVLTPREREEFLSIRDKGVPFFEALERTTNRPEVWKEIAKELQLEFSEIPIEGRECVSNPYKATSSNPVIVPPQKNGEVEVSNDFWVNLIERAVKEGWGDIHYEPSSKYYIVRINNSVGKIEKIKEIPKEQGIAYLNQILTRAGMDPNSNIDQDGSISLADLSSDDPSKENVREFLRELVERGTPCNLRLSVIPTIKGRSLVVRVLPYRTTGVKDLLELGYTKEKVEKLKSYSKIETGLVIVSGPTGSGKTTLIYGLIQYANPFVKKIVSVEDPVEAEIDGVQQVEVRRPLFDPSDPSKRIGIDFAYALRSFLRQKPNVIVVGEIRDPETAETAVYASDTGHLVISTVHANDEVETVNRLLSLVNKAGTVPLPMLVNQIKLIVSQRLVPVVCPECLKRGVFELGYWKDVKDSLPLDQREKLSNLHDNDEIILRKVSEDYCGKCQNGYVKRVPIVGLLEFDDEIRDFIVKSNGYFERKDLLRLAKAKGFESFVDDAVKKLRDKQIVLEDTLLFV